MAEESAEAYLAWFTDGEFDKAVKAPPPDPAPPAVPGTAGEGVRLTREIPLDVPLLAKESGMIGFWIKPAWNGDDGKTHRLLRMGEAVVANPPREVTPEDHDAGREDPEAPE